MSFNKRFLPELIPGDNKNEPSLMFPGLRITLSNKATAKSYPETREFVNEKMDYLGRPGIIFLKAAIAGVFVPWFPACLGYRPFGRGVGGILRTNLVSICTSVFFVYSSPLLVRSRWESIRNDKAIPAEQKLKLIFHIQESRRVKDAVLAKANLSRPRPAPHPDIPVRLQRILRLVQAELYVWKSNIALLCWPAFMEKALQEVFADDAFRKVVTARWHQYLNIETDSHDTPRITFPLDLVVFEKMDRFSDSPGVVMRKRLYKSLPNFKQQAYKSDMESRCTDFMETKPKLESDISKYKALAKEYLSKQGKRDEEWEKEFAESYILLDRRYQRRLGNLCACGEWYKALNGRFPELDEEGLMAARHIIRLAQTNSATKDKSLPNENDVGTEEIASLIAEPKTSTTKPTIPSTEEKGLGKKAATSRDLEKKTTEKRSDEDGVQNS